MVGRVNDGTEWKHLDMNANGGNTGSQTPQPPVADGDGSIFVGIPSFRGESLAAMEKPRKVCKKEDPRQAFFLHTQFPYFLCCRWKEMCRNSSFHFR